MKTCRNGSLVVVVLVAMGCGGGGHVGTLAASDLGIQGNDAVGSDTESGTDAPLPDGAVCRPGEAKCMGSVFLACNATGSDWMSVACPDGQACTDTGCKAVPVDDVIVGPDTTPVDGIQPPEDLPANDTIVPEDVPPVTDTVEPTDPGQNTDPGTPANCGTNPPCAANRECCETATGLRCVPKGQCAATACQTDQDCTNQVCCPGQFPGAPSSCQDSCGTTTGCQTDQDCTNQVCCPGQFPGAPGTCQDSCGTTTGCQSDQDCPGQKCCPGTLGAAAKCAATCGGIGNVPTCTATTDCSGGQTCVDLMLTKICLSQCTADTDCNGQTCQDIGAMGYSLAKVCACALDTDCASPLLCCDIPYLGGKTCMTQCM